jgi:hypothetical protein
MAAIHQKPLDLIVFDRFMPRAKPTHKTLGAIFVPAAACGIPLTNMDVRCC